MYTYIHTHTQMYICMYLYNDGSWKELKHQENSLNLNFYILEDIMTIKREIFMTQRKGCYKHLAREGKRAAFGFFLKFPVIFSSEQEGNKQNC